MSGTTKVGTARTGAGRAPAFVVVAHHIETGPTLLRLAAVSVSPDDAQDTNTGHLDMISHVAVTPNAF
jgi:hypothetical protein